MILGYARVSTDGQTLDAQEAALKAAGAERIFAEKISGAVIDRKALARAIAALAPRDLLLVTGLDRLARSTRDLLNVLAIIGDKGAGFRSLAGFTQRDSSLSLLAPGAWLTTTATPGTSGSVNASAGAGAVVTTPSEVMQISARSSPCSSATSSAPAWMATLACRLEPMRFCARSSSSAPVTTRVTRSMAAQRAASAAFSQSAGVFCSSPINCALAFRQAAAGFAPFAASLRNSCKAASAFGVLRSSASASSASAQR